MSPPDQPKPETPRRETSTPRGDGPATRDEDLFGKLDQLISKHQGRAPREREETQIPILTEPMATVASATPPSIPVLEEVVEAPATDATSSLQSDRRRRLQIALYLRLRQLLDDELEASLAAQGALAETISDAALARLAQSLRNALPAIVSESVDQALGAEARTALPNADRGGA
jgi:hypothetical protein